jgi:hypothetical protein
MLRGISIRQVFRNTPANRFTMADKVKLIGVKIGKSRTLQKPKVVCQTYTSGDTVKYSTSITFIKDDKAVLSCSCDDFMYRWEYALAKKGGAEVRYGNGEHPESSNPTLIAGCCKHVIALYNKLQAEDKVPQV